MITRTGNGYILSVGFYDLTTGIACANVTSNSVPDMISVFNGNKNACSEAVYRISEMLGINLNNAQVKALLGGDAGLANLGSGSAIYDDVLKAKINDMVSRKSICKRTEKEQRSGLSGTDHYDIRA